MSSDDGNCGSGDEEECTELSGAGLVIFIWVCLQVDLDTLTRSLKKSGAESNPCT
ncbi:expressed unknown protein [Ectocarpus siliculosus]|uniref:Uncharacterized protein n=1 Tax=Ectocarpus siliculosus TaxID=2880 RepID=D8LNB5_ECTSI|nr:expressed unknown protein [Ectocarpus siliculosus]|eukprot:CBN77272.1 expressed unknown protein [Ectocarpus siliculosus]